MSETGDSAESPAPSGHASGEPETTKMTNTVEIVVINLQRAAERRELIKDQFSEIKVPWSFFEAHTSLVNEALHYNEAEYRGNFGEPLSGPQLAVWSSHYTVIQKFLQESQSDYLLVFEDDVIYDTAFPLKKLVDYCAENDVHYIRLYGMVDTVAEMLSCFFDRWIIRYRSGPCGAQAYIVSKEGAKKLTDSIRNIDTAVDVAMDRFWRTGLPVYSVFPFPVIERFSPSTIPIPQTRAPTASERAARNRERWRNKIGKIAANLKLAARDRRMKKSGWAFKQVDNLDLG